MGRNAKIKKQRKAEKKVALSAKGNQINTPSNSNINVETTPQLLRYWLTHQLTKDWIISQWDLLLGSRPFFPLNQQQIIASQLLDALLLESHSGYDLDARVELELQSPPYNLAVGLNFEPQTLWVGIQDLSTNTIFHTSDDDEFQLRLIPPA